MILFLVFILLSAPDFSYGNQPSENPRITVQTSRGEIRGFHVNNALLNNFYGGEADVFLGIPFATPPIGEKRFQKSEIHGKYMETIEATKFGDICPQKAGFSLADKYDVGTSEDCLTLNIMAPNTSDHSSKYPVMVYIYGGALETGDQVFWLYHGIVSNIVRRGVIWVSINYRVGFHGFFTTYSPEFPPNRGLWDQVTALQWIHEEITSFGGDPEKVTVIGHSAGACSASYLALSPAVSPDWISKIIMLSASAEVCFENVYGEFTQSLDRAEQICNINARDGWSEEKIAKMRDCVSTLNHSQISAHDINTFRWNAVIDNELFTDYPSKMAWRNIPMLSGSTAEEYAVYVQWQLASGEIKMEDYKDVAKGAETQIKAWLKAIFGMDKVEEIMKEVAGEYGALKDSDDSLTYMQYCIRVLSDLIYIRAVGEEAERHVRDGNRNIWLYQIDFRTDYFSFYKLDNYIPVFHGIELFLLMQPDYAWTDADQPQKWGDREVAVADMIAREITDFVKYGKPSKTWEPLDLNRMNYWRIDYYGDESEGRTEKYPNGYGGAHYKFWKNISAVYRKDLERLKKQQRPNPKTMEKLNSKSVYMAILFGAIILYFCITILKVFGSARKDLPPSQLVSTNGVSPK